MRLWWVIYSLFCLRVRESIGLFCKIIWNFGYKDTLENKKKAEENQKVGE